MSAFQKKIVVKMKFNGSDEVIEVISKLLDGTVEPDFIFIETQQDEFPNRDFDLPNDFMKFVCTHPQVKIVWDEKYESIDGFKLLTYDEFLRLRNVKIDDVFNGSSPKVVVAMTSWEKRIQNCVYVINCLLNNTRKPDIVFLSLSSEEFPNLCDDLPDDLATLCMTNPRVKLNWVSGPNTKSMKKVYPILPFLDDDDMIVLCDDDFDIPDNFIQVMVDEFKEHGCMFPISGGTNPKWHLNLPLYHTRYNTIAATSIFTKKMLNGYSSVWSKEIIETYKDDTIHTLLCLSNGYYPIPSKYLSTYCGITEQKIPLYNEVDGMKNNRIWKSDKETIATFVRKYNASMDHTFHQSLFNLVLFDSFDVAGDNAETFYRMAREQYPWLNMTFLLSKDCPDWKRLENDGFNLYPIDGDDVGELMKNASYILWSKDTSLFKHLYANKKKSILLSHGRTHLMYDCSEYFINRLVKCISYVSCTSDEEASVVQKYTEGKIQPLVFGFPRHDLILRKSQQRNATMKPGDRKQILISFHYRPYWLYKTDQSLLGSEYLSGINKFLNSEQIKKLSMEFNVVFIPHARYKKLMSFFDVPEYISVQDKEQFQDVFVQSDFLITDFSSTSFEFAYMDKPTFMYVPDFNLVKNSIPNYHMEYIKNYKHLVWCGTIDDVVSNIHKYDDNIDGFNVSSEMFKYHDTNNTKRMLDWMFTKYGI